MISRNKYLSGAFIDQVQRFHRPSFEPTNFSLRVQALSRKKGLNQLWHLHFCCRYFGFYMLSLSITTEIAERICRRHHGNPFYTPEPDVAWLELWGNPWFDGESSLLGLESTALEFGRLVTILVDNFLYESLRWDDPASNITPKWIRRIQADDSRESLGPKIVRQQSFQSPRQNSQHISSNGHCYVMPTWWLMVAKLTVFT